MNEHGNGTDKLIASASNAALSVYTRECSLHTSLHTRCACKRRGQHSKMTVKTQRRTKKCRERISSNFIIKLIKIDHSSRLRFLLVYLSPFWILLRSLAAQTLATASNKIKVPIVVWCKKQKKRQKTNGSNPLMCCRARVEVNERIWHKIFGR